MLGIVKLADGKSAYSSETCAMSMQPIGSASDAFVIGTQAENRKHAELMLKISNMEHDERFMAHVGPGKTGQIVWAFNRAGEFEFACLIAGH